MASSGTRDVRARDELVKPSSLGCSVDTRSWTLRVFLLLGELRWPRWLQAEPVIGFSLAGAESNGFSLVLFSKDSYGHTASTSFSMLTYVVDETSP